MKKYILLTLLVFLVEVSAQSKVLRFSPEILNHKRHLVFQAGKVGDKPWDHKAAFDVKASFSSAVFTKLVYIDSHYNIQPGVIKSWSWEFNTKSFLFTIDTNLEFSKYRKLRIEDVEFSIVKNFLNPKGLRFRASLSRIRGLGKIRESMFKSGSYEGIQLIKPNKMRIFLDKEDPSFMYSLSNMIPFIAPIEDFKNDLFSFKSIPKGTGAYFVEWSSPVNSRVFLRRKTNHSSKGKNQKYPLTIDFINHGDPLENKVDLAMSAGARGLKDNVNYREQYGLAPDSIVSIDFNYSTNVGNNKLFRKAVSLALDRSKLYKGYAHLKETHQLIPSRYFGQNKNKKFEYSPSKSRKIVRNFFKNLSSRNKPLKAIFHGKPGAPLKPYILEITKQLENVGIYLKFFGRNVVIQFGHDKDAILKENGYSVSFTNSIGFFSRFVSLPHQLNLIAKKDEKTLKLYLAAEKETSKIRKAKLLQELMGYLQDEFYVLPLAEGFPAFYLGQRVSSIGVEHIFTEVDFDKVVMRD